MTPKIRLRRHTDGRVALSVQSHIWRVTNDVSQIGWASDVDVSGPGWSELLVAELPEPDGEAIVDDVPFWDTNFGRVFGDDAHEFVNNIGFDDLAEVRSDALKNAGRCRRLRTVPGRAGDDVKSSALVGSLTR